MIEKSPKDLLPIGMQLFFRDFFLDKKVTKKSSRLECCRTGPFPSPIGMAPARSVLALCWPGGLQEGQGLFNLLSQHSQYGFRSNRHLGDRTEAGSHVLYAGSKGMDFIVDDQETVVVAMR